MKFTNGYWVLKPEYDIHFATQGVRAVRLRKKRRLGRYLYRERKNAHLVRLACDGLREKQADRPVLHDRIAQP